MSETISSFTDNCMIVNISLSITYDGSIYDAARRCWRASKTRAEAADYVLAVADGIVKGVFKPEKWNVTTAKECEEEKNRCMTMGVNMGECIPENRIRFIGCEAPDDIKKKYLDKAIPDEYRKSQNPVQYTFQGSITII